MTRTLKLLAPLALGLLAAPLVNAQSTCGPGNLCGASARELFAVCTIWKCFANVATDSLLL